MSKADKHQCNKRRGSELREALAADEVKAPKRKAGARCYGVEWEYLPWREGAKPWLYKTWYETEKARDAALRTLGKDRWGPVAARKVER